MLFLSFYSDHPFLLLFTSSILYFLMLGFGYSIDNKENLFANEDKHKTKNAAGKKTKDFLQINPLKALNEKKCALAIASFYHKSINDKENSILKTLWNFLDDEENTTQLYIIPFEENVLKDEQTFSSFIEYITQNDHKLQKIIFNLPCDILLQFYEKISLLTKLGIQFNITDVQKNHIEHIIPTKSSFTCFCMTFSQQLIEQSLYDESLSAHLYELHQYAQYFIVLSCDVSLAYKKLPSFVDFEYNPSTMNKYTVAVEEKVIPYRSKTVGSVE